MPNPRCRVRDCTAEPTHILLVDTYSWYRLAMPADQAPDIVTNPIVRNEKNPAPIEHGKPVPYYCLTHAQEKASHGTNK